MMSEVEKHETMIRLLRINWNDSQAVDEWQRISFQLHGASLMADGKIKDELDLLSSIAHHRCQMLKPDYDEYLALERRCKEVR